jgi:hypothetical protein
VKFAGKVTGNLKRDLEALWDMSCFYPLNFCRFEIMIDRFEVFPGRIGATKMGKLKGRYDAVRKPQQQQPPEIMNAIRRGFFDKLTPKQVAEKTGLHWKTIKRYYQGFRDIGLTENVP